jgi:hypothetical protein
MRARAIPKPLAVILTTLPLLANDFPKHLTCDFADFAQILGLLGKFYENS